MGTECFAALETQI